MRFLRCTIAFALILQGCTNTDEQVKSYIVSGQSLYNQGLLDKSKIEFKNAIQLDGNQEQAYYYLALIEEKNENWTAAFKNFNTVVKLNPNNLDARIKLSRLYLLAGEYDNARNQVDNVLIQAPANVDALVQKGTILFKQSKFEDAMKIVDQVLSLGTNSIDAVVLKAAILMKTHNYDIAIKLADDVLKYNPNELQIYQLKLEIYTQANESDRVEATYQDILKRFPQHIELLMPLAKHYSNNGQNVKALETLEKLVAIKPDNFSAKLALLDFLIVSNPSQFKVYIDDFLKANPEEVGLYFRLAEYYVKQEQFDDAKKALEWIIRYREDNNEALAAKMALASIAVQNNNIDEGTKLVNEVLKVDVRNYQAMLLRATIDLLHTNYNDAIAQLREIIRDFPDSDEALVQLATAYAKKSSPELADENFRKAVDLNPGNFDAVLPVVSGMINREELDRAEDILQKALKIDATQPSILQAMAQIKLLKKDWVGSEQVAKMIAKKTDGQGFSSYLRGKISESQGNYDEAVIHYEQAIATTPTLLDALYSLIHCYEALEQFDKIDSYLDKYLKDHPKVWQVMALKSEAYIIKKQWVKAISLLQSAIAQWPSVPKLYEALANVYASQNNVPKVIEVYLKALESMPEDMQIRLMLASAYEQVNEFDKALEYYNILINEPNHNGIVINNLASLLLDHFESPENINRALDLASAFKSSGNPYFLDTYGWALFKAGKFDEALKVFRNVSIIEQDVAIFYYHLGYSYFKLNDKLSAITELKKAISIAKRNGNFSEKEYYSNFLQTVIDSK